MKKIIRLTESDLARIVRRVIKENQKQFPDINKLISCAKENGITIGEITKLDGCNVFSPDVNKCIQSIITKLGEKASDFATCAGIEIPTTGPMSESRRSRRRFGMRQNATSRHYLNENLKSERVFDEILYIIDTSNSTEEFEKRIKEIEPELEDLPKEKYDQYMSFINSLKDNWSFENKEER